MNNIIKAAGEPRNFMDYPGLVVKPYRPALGKDVIQHCVWVPSMQLDGAMCRKPATYVVESPTQGRGAPVCDACAQIAFQMIQKRSTEQLMQFRNARAERKQIAWNKRNKPS